MENALLSLAVLILGLQALLALAFIRVLGSKLSWKQALTVYFVWPVFRPMQFIEFLACQPLIFASGFDDKTTKKAKR